MADIASSLSSWRAWIEIPSPTGQGRQPRRSPHGERGLKWVGALIRDVGCGRSPHGERGLKFDHDGGRNRLSVSRSPHGERGLKYRLEIRAFGTGHSRSPHGERGLK